MSNYIIIEILLINRGEELSVPDVPPYCCIAPVISFVSTSLQYHFSFNTHSI
jgi:hypothetical protein